MTANPLNLPRLIGHRGLAAHAPENTLASLRAAKAHGLSMVEFDVRLSADSVPHLFHDDDLSRCSDGWGSFSALDSAALQKLDAGRWFAPHYTGEGIPTLRAALLLCRQLALAVNIELKPNLGEDSLTAQAVARVLKEIWPEPEGLLVSSFNEASMDAACAYLSAYPRGLLIDEPWRRAELLQALRGYRCQSLNLNASLVEPEEIAAIKAEGYALLAYTVNEQAEAERLWQLGVDALFSDEPLVGPAKG